MNIIIAVCVVSIVHLTLLFISALIIEFVIMNTSNEENYYDFNNN
jgi:hypothetical protein